MAAARPILGLVALFFLACGIVLQFFVILSGTPAGTPTDLVYFLEATTNSIPNARNPSRWTYFSICGADGLRNVNCGAIVPDLPFDPSTNFGTQTGVPQAFIGTSKFFYLSRFAWPFYLIAAFFAVVGAATGLLALCTRLGAYLSGFNTMVALFFQTLAAALITAWAVIGRDVFNAAGQTATLGRYGFGFMWGSVAAFFMSTVLFCVGGTVSRDKTGGSGKFGRSRSTRSRGSFIDSESQRRVKDEYA